jgi:hypothetical protein
MEEATIARKTDGATESKPTGKRERVLREAEAVERVYRKYGTNLTAFYRDAHREAQKESEKKAR